MGMKAYTYVVYGIKTTRQECKDKGIDIYEQFDENENIDAVYGADTDDVLIGKKLFEAEDDADGAIKIEPPHILTLCTQLVSSGVEVSVEDIGLYAMTVWL